jgi:hypothetical protein
MNIQILVQVTQTDIDEGRPGTTQECPIAKALMRVIADCLWVSVNGYDCIWQLKNGSKYRAEIPESGVGFIIQFDSCRGGQPFSFVLEPWEGQPLGFAPVISPKHAYKGILIDSNGTVKEVTHYAEEFTLLRWSAPKKLLVWWKAEVPGDKQRDYAKEHAQSTGGGMVSQ